MIKTVSETVLSQPTKKGKRALVPPMNKDSYCAVSYAAAYLSVSRSKLYKMMDSGMVKSIRLGKSRRIAWESVLSLVSGNAT